MSAVQIGAGVWRIPTAPADLVNSYLFQGADGSLKTVAHLPMSRVKKADEPAASECDLVERLRGRASSVGPFSVSGGCPQSAAGRG